MAKKLVAEDLITELGLGDLPEEKKMELVIKWGNIVQKDVMMRVLTELSENDKEELDKMLVGNTDNYEEIYKFLEKKLPNLDDIVKEEIENFRQEMKETFKQIGFIK